MTPDYITHGNVRGNIWLDRVSGWPLHLFAIIAGVIFLAGSFNTIAGVVGFLLSCAAIVVWIGFFIIDVAVWRRDIFRRRASRRWAIGPLILVAAIVLFCSGIPFYAAFMVSKPAMDRFVTEIKTAAPGTPIPAHRRVGLFNFSDIQITSSSLHFRADYGGVFDWNGFAYYTTPLPPSDPPFFGYKRISANWYICMRD